MFKNVKIDEKIPKIHQKSRKNVANQEKLTKNVTKVVENRRKKGYKNYVKA